MGDLAPSEGVDHRSMTVFSGPVQSGTMGDLLGSRIPTENFTSLELEDNILQSSGGHFPPSPPSQPTNPPPASCSSLTSSSSSVASSTTSLLTQTSIAERTFSRTHVSHIMAKSDATTSSPQGSHYSSEHVPSPYSDHISSPHTSFQSDTPLLLEVPLSSVAGTPRSSWTNLPLPLADPTQFGNLIGSDSHLISTSLSTPPATTQSVTLQPMAALSAMPQSGLTGLTTPVSASSSLSSSSLDLLTSTQPKQQLPQFSAAFGHQLASHSGIPKDVQPSHSSTAPPAGFSVVSATAASANSAMPPFTQSKWEMGGLQLLNDSLQIHSTPKSSCLATDRAPLFIWYTCAMWFYCTIWQWICTRLDFPLIFILLLCSQTTSEIFGSVWVLTVQCLSVPSAGSCSQTFSRLWWKKRVIVIWQKDVFLRDYQCNSCQNHRGFSQWFGLVCFSSLKAISGQLYPALLRWSFHFFFSVTHWKTSTRCDICVTHYISSYLTVNDVEF